MFTLLVITLWLPLFPESPEPLLMVPAHAPCQPQDQLVSTRQPHSEAPPFYQMPPEILEDPIILLDLASDPRQPSHMAAAYDLVKLGKKAVPVLLQDIEKHPPRDSVHRRPTRAMVTIALQGDESLNSVIDRLGCIKKDGNPELFDQFLYSTVVVVNMAQSAGYECFMQGVIRQFGVNARSTEFGFPQNKYDVGLLALDYLMRREDERLFPYLASLVGSCKDKHAAARVARYLAERGFSVNRSELDSGIKETHLPDFFVAFILTDPRLGHRAFGSGMATIEPRRKGRVYLRFELG